jgi:monomeric isocitrate dehydrogenase
MAINRKMIDADRLTKLLRDPIVIKIVTVLNVVSLSILELLEYGITRKDISQSLAEGILHSTNLQSYMMTYHATSH